MIIIILVQSPAAYYFKDESRSNVHAGKNNLFIELQEPEVNHSANKRKYNLTRFSTLNPPLNSHTIYVVVS